VKQTYLGVVFAVVAVLSVSVAAHHGAASFDTTKEYTLKGKVTEWIWANPQLLLEVRRQGRIRATFVTGRLKSAIRPT